MAQYRYVAALFRTTVVPQKGLLLLGMSSMRKRMQIDILPTPDSPMKNIITEVAARFVEKNVPAMHTSWRVSAPKTTHFLPLRSATLGKMRAEMSQPVDCMAPMRPICAPDLHVRSYCSNQFSSDSSSVVLTLLYSDELPQNPMMSPSLNGRQGTGGSLIKFGSVEHSYFGASVRK